MQQNANLDLDILKLASSAHASPADEPEHGRIEGDGLAHGVGFKFRAEGEGCAEASHQKKDDEHDHTCRN